MPVSAAADYPDQLERDSAARQLHSTPCPRLASIEARKRL
jgi:hypothetical protein